MRENIPSSHGNKKKLGTPSDKIKYDSGDTDSIIHGYAKAIERLSGMGRKKKK